MAYEREWEAVAPKLFTANGTANGEIHLLDTKGFRLRQIVRVTSATQEAIDLIVRRVDPTKLIVSKNSDPGVHDLTRFLIADGATVEALPQGKKDIPFEEQEANRYEPGPTNAKRVILVDPVTGEVYNGDNPFPVDAVVNVDNINFPVSTEPEIFNVNAANKNTAYNFVLPIGTKSFTIKVRENACKFKTFWAALEINTKYLSHTVGTKYVKENMNLAAAKVVYFSVSKDAQIVEIEYWI